MKNFNWAVCFLITTAAIADEGQIELLKPGDLSAWREPHGEWRMAGDVAMDAQDDHKLTVKEGRGIIVNGDKGRTNDLLTRQEFGDIEAHIEFVIPAKSNSGIYFMGRYELQVYDSHGVAKDKYPGIECGGIYPRWIDNHEVGGHSPRVNVSRPPGQWQTFDVIFRAPRFDGAGKKTANAVFVKVAHNGTVIHENIEVTGPTRAAHYEDEKPTGPLMIQGDHGPVAYRNLRIRPLTGGTARSTVPFFPFCIDWHDANKRTFQEQALMLKELGYDGVGHIWLDRVAERLKTLDDAGLKLYQITMTVDVAPGKPPYDEQKFKDVLALVKGRHVQFDLLVNGMKPSDASVDPHAVEILRTMSELARDSGSQLLLYPHLGSWVERIEDSVRVADKVDRPNVGVMFNLCHWLRVDQQRDFAPLLKRAMPRLWAISINGADTNDDKAGWDRYIQPLDKGSFDVGSLLKVLKELGYRGPIGLQCYGIGGDAREHLARSMSAWKKLSKNLNDQEGINR